MRSSYVESTKPLAALTSLRYLDLSSNLISSVFFLRDMNQLEHFDVSFNSLWNSNEFQILRGMPHLHWLNL